MDSGGNSQNFRWTRQTIAEAYQIENPDWSWDECWEKAGEINRELNRLNRQMWHNNKVHYKHTKPFSFFDTKDSEFGDTYHEW